MTCFKFTLLSESDLEKINENSVQIDGCNCAAVRVKDNGAIVYDYSLLIEHFHDHEGMWESDEEGEEGTTAMEWIDYNVVRGLAYITCGIRPVIANEDGIEWGAEEDEED